MKRYLILLLLSAMPLLSQVVEWDSSGNGLLNGEYRFREVIWRPVQGPDQLSEATGTYGIIRFDGLGNYTIDAKQFSSLTPQAVDIDFAGTYVISASGLGFIRRQNPNGGWIQGTVSNGVFIGSSTEHQTNNLFIATRIGNSPMTTAAFNQSYTLAYTDVRVPSLSQTRDVMFAFQGNGGGGIAPLNLTGRIAGDFATTNQNITGSTYSFSGGVGLINFNAVAAANTLISGTKEVYVSPDGAFIFGGSTTGWDMFVGVRTPASVAASVFDYLYYQAGIEVDRGDTLQSFKLDTYYGAFTPRGAILIGHQRILPAPSPSPFNFTYSDDVVMDANGVQSDFSGYRHVLTADGRFRVGVGEESFLGINVAVKAPELTGPGVFLNPVGVVNAAGFTPFTTGISPGEVITLFGTGIAESVDLDETFPLTFHGLQVRINGKLAPIYKTSPGEVSVVVPYDVGTVNATIAEIQVFRNGVASNPVTLLLNNDTPAMFTVNNNGVGYAVARHADYSPITPQSPARPGEIILLAISGMGPTIPPIVAGTPGPVNPLSVTPEKFVLKIRRIPATVEYSGLAPLLGGLYQVNVKIPEGLAPGDAFVQIEGKATTDNQAKIPIGLPVQ